MSRSTGRQLKKTLHRDSLETNWGFRIQGGTYLNAAITVQKVIRDTPADGVLHPGDVLLEIQGKDSSNFTQVEAQELVKSAELSLCLCLSRSGKDATIKLPFLLTSSSSPCRNTKKIIRGPMNFDFGTDYNPPKWSPAESSSSLLDYKPPMNLMLTKLHDTLKNPTQNQGVSRHISTATSGDYPPWSTPSTLATPVTIYSERNQCAQHASVNPAWKGSLRSSDKPLSSDTHIGAHQTHTPHIGSIHCGADGGVSREAAAARGGESDTARAVHLQYNSPLGLYSKSSAAATMSQQLNGGSEAGTMSDTQVQRMIRDEEKQKNRAKSHLSFYDNSSYTGLSSHRVLQSPSVRALESKFVEDEIGISDF